MTRGALVGFTAAALVCFAANGLLSRLALAHGAIDAGSFTAIRLASGALVLLALARATRPGVARPRRSWAGVGSLFLYAAPFSYAYVELGAGVGALVLFGVVQLTMIGWGIARGERPGALVWLGLALALGGLVALVLPSAHAPSPVGLALMALAGVGWGAYSLLGRGAGDPLLRTASNFAWDVPLAAALLGAAAAAAPLHVTATGALLAAASGAIASGIGYSLWYAALRGLTATRAGILQLLVPIEVALGGVALLGEPMTPRLALVGAVILGGVALAILGR